MFDNEEKNFSQSLEQDPINTDESVNQTAEETAEETAKEPAKEPDFGSESQSRYTSYEFAGQEEPARQQETPPKKKKGYWGMFFKCIFGGLVFGAAAYGCVFALNHLAGPLFAGKTEKNAPVINTTTTLENSNSGSITADYSDSAYVYDVSDVTESVMPSVVAIVNTGTKEVNTFFGTQAQDFKSSGSGVIVGSNDEELLIATNNHVVTDATKLEITFSDETKASAVVKGKSDKMDLAVVAVQLDDLEDSTIDQIKIATLGDSDSLKVGEPAIAIGNALGYGQSVTYGVISALNREVTVQTDSTYGFGNSQTITNKLIQTDAAINPGNSGGALFNIKGEVIGINSVKYASSEVEGMGYAIPITAAQPILDNLMTQKTREKVDDSKRSYLGIRGADVIDQAASIYGMPKGCYVVNVIKDSAAQKAGVKEGDIITKVGDSEVSSMDELTEALQYYAAGETIDVVVFRSNSGQYEEQTLSVTLDRYPEDD